MAKLRPGMREKNGSIEYRFMVDGKRHSVCAKTVKECLEKEVALRTKLSTTGYVKNRGLTLDKYFPEWIASKELSSKSGTILRYTSIYRNHIQGTELAGRKIVDLERREISQFISSLAEKSKGNANNALIVIKIMLNDAVRDDIITRSPAYQIKHIAADPTDPAVKTTHRALTRDEQALFLKALQCEWYCEALTLQLLTGMRGGEICALRWSDIDDKMNVIHVRRTSAFSKDGKNIENAPKTPSGIRDIPMNADIRDVLDRQRQKQAVSKITDIDGHIFLGSKGGAIYTRIFQRVIARVLKKLENDGTPIPQITDHALRDTFATRYIEGGGSMQTLKAILGHSSISMTMDLYAQVLPDIKHSEMDRIKII